MKKIINTTKYSRTLGIQLLPNIVHFKAGMYISLVVVLWPLATPENKTLKKAYKIVSKLYFIYFIAFFVTQIIQLIILLKAQQINYGEVTNNLAITLVYLNSIVRCKVIKGKVIRNIITEMIKFEEKLFKDMEESIITIYKDNVKRNTVFCVVFVSNTLLICLVYTVWPFFIEPEIVEVNNITMTVRYLPVSAWLPFDVQKHYVTGYIMLLFNASYIGSMFFMCSEVLAFGLMTYPLGQIGILKHILKNFSKYKVSVQREMGFTPDVASEFQLRECIIMHQNIINYIDVFNDEMKQTYLLDFLQCSFQLSCILYRLLGQSNAVFIAINVQFVSVMLVRLFITYWTANEIMLQSMDISRELYNMEWLDESIKVKKMILMMMMRGQRPLKLFIGSFTAMTLETFITIIKVTYSYISLVYRRL